MATENPTPVAPTPAVPPAAPPPPAKPVTPPIPAAQQASMATPAPAPKVASTPKENSLAANLKKVSAEVFGSESPDVKEAAARAAKTPGVETKPAPAAEPAKAAEKTPEKPAEKPAEAKDRFADVAPPDGATEVTQKGWKALKEKANAEISAAEKKLADAEAQIETFRKATPAEAADVAKLQAELKAAHDRLAILDVSATPAFHREYVEPKNKALGEADQLIKDNGIEGAPEVASLLNLPRAEFAKRVSELAKDMPAFDQGTFVTAMREAYRLQGDQKNALANAAELRKNIEAQNAQKQKAAFEATFKNFSEAMKPMEVPEKATAEERADIESYNEGLAGIRSTAERNAFGRIDEKGVSELAAKAAAADFFVRHGVPRMQREYAKAQQLIKDLTTELDGLRAAKSPGTFSGDATPAPRDLSRGTFADAMAEAKRMSAAR